MSASRVLLGLAALLLLLTAGIHAMGQGMVSQWVEVLGHQQRMAICLVWMTDSLSWAVVALIWAVAAWKQERGWLGASALGALIPFTMVVGIMGIEPAFFGGWMLAGSIALAIAGILLSRKGHPAS